MTSILEKITDVVFYLFAREKYKLKIIERKIEPYKIKYYGSVESELKKAMGDELYPAYLHAQASDIKFLEAVFLLYDIGFISQIQPSALVPHLVHGLYVYSTESKPKGIIAILQAMDIVKTEIN